MADPDVVIVGAGAAGIGAGLALRDRGIPFVILEAAGRVGGRAFTDTASLPRPWDQGCHWFHSADLNPLVAFAYRLGVAYAREVRVDAVRLSRGGRWLDRAERDARGAAVEAAFDAVYAAASRGADVPIAGVLPEAGAWAAEVRHMLQLMASADPEEASALGYGDYEDTATNWPVTGGLGTLVARMAEGLPVRLGVPVSAIAEAAGKVRIETPEGTIAAKAAIVTASTNVLRAGLIAFGPGPARDLLDLVEDVPCGAYEKVAIAFRRRVVDEPGVRFISADPGDGVGAPLSFQVPASGAPMLIAHLGGSLVRGLAAPAERIAFARERLAGAFGSGILGEIAAVATTGWSAAPFVRGAYSCARPGAAARRHAMIEADTGRIAFAGEAFSRRFQGTAHGAFESGQSVAERLSATL